MSTRLGWLAALILAVACFILALQALQQNTRVSVLEAEVRTLQTQLRVQREALPPRTAQDTPQAAADAASTPPGTAPTLSGLQPFEATVDDDGPAGPDMAAVLEMLRGGGDGGANPMAAMAEMFKGERGEQMLDMSMGMMMQQQYGGLWAELKLDPGRRARVEEILSRTLRASARLGMAMFEGSGLPDNMEADMQFLLEEQQAALEEVLTPEEMAAFEAYEATKAERMVAQSFDMSLQWQAPGLAPETRNLVRDVLVEETMARTETDPVAAAADPGAGMQGTIDALTAAESRLQELLPPEEFEEAQRFIASQRAMMESMADWMPSFEAGMPEQP